MAQSQDDKKDKPVYGALTLYREGGHFILKRKQYDECKPFFYEANNANPKDRRTRLGRSWARAYTLQYDAALSDLDFLLKIDRKDLRVKCQKALMTYLAGDFENAFILNVRGKKLRREPKWFFKGASMCNETIHNCIGERAGHPLRDYYDIIKTIAMKRAMDLHKGFQVKSKFRRKRKTKQDHIVQEGGKRRMRLLTVPPEDKDDLECKGSIVQSLNEVQIEEELYKPAERFKYQPLQKCTDNIDNLLSEKYLERMYLDKLFLKELRHDPRLACPNYRGTAKITEMAKRGYKDVTTRQEILRSRKPFYYIKYLEGQLSPALLRRQQKEVEKQQEIIKENVECLLDDLRKARAMGHTQECIQIADKTKTYIDKTPLKLLPKKEVFLKQMYDLIGEAHLDVYRIDEERPEFDIITRINFLFGKSVSKEAIDDSVIMNLKGGFIDLKQAIRETEKRMRNATTPMEVVWLYFELARFNVEMKKYDLARVYAKKCINLARMVGNMIFALNGSFQICKAYVQQNRRNEAKNQLLKTRDIAQQIEREDIVIYINKCLEVVEEIEIADTHGSRIIQQREKEITSVIIADAVKEQVSHLFQQMSAIPSSRRMSIMPGVSRDDEKEVSSEVQVKKLLHKLVAQRQSIKPKSKDFDMDDLGERLRERGDDKDVQF